MDFEKEILDILGEIKCKDIKNIKEIEDINNEILESIYANFLNYEKNIKNYEHAYNFVKKLGYEYVEELEHLKIGDIIAGFDLSNFFNLKIKCLGVFMKIKDKKRILVKQFPRFFHFIYFNKYIFFRKINSKDKVKMLLLETIEKM